MPIVIIDGEVQLGPDGVLQGWCWNPKRPTERLVLEILIDDRIVSTFVASRFREDLRERNIGDGYFGFVATLPKSLLDAGRNFVISARERGSRCCFWQQVRGEPSLPEDFTGRYSEARYCFSRIAQSKGFRTLGGPLHTPRIAREFGALGTHLLKAARYGNQPLTPITEARTALVRRNAPVALDTFWNPEASVILIADSPSNDVISTISAAAPTLTLMKASLLLIDRGFNADAALAPSLIGDLRYIFDTNDDLSLLIANALKYSEGDLLLFFRNPPEYIARCLPEFVSQMNDGSSLYVDSRSAEIACEICAESSQNVLSRIADLPSGLAFAGRRSFFLRFLDSLQLEHTKTGIDDVDLAILAIRGHSEICVWNEPYNGQESHFDAEVADWTS